MTLVNMLFYTRNTLAPTVLRLAFAFLYFFHSGQKVFGLFGGEGLGHTWKVMTESGGMGLPAIVAFFLLVLECVLPLFLLLGFAVRVAALGIILHISIMLATLYSGTTFVEKEFPFFVLAGALALLFSGAGEVSLDRQISRVIQPSEDVLFSRRAGHW